jgi:hypothetical protein
MKQLALSSPRVPLDYSVTYLPIFITDAVLPIAAAPGALRFKVRDWIRSAADRASPGVRRRSAARLPLPDTVCETAHPTPPVSEFVYFLAEEGHVEGLLDQHVCSDSGVCTGCGKAWPCNWRRLTDQAVEISSATRTGRHSVGLLETRGSARVELIVGTEETRERPQ